MSDPVRAAYAAGLAMLSRRELSEAQLRERLRRKDHDAEAIAAAVVRLKDARALDDQRVARAAARTEAQVRSRGRAYILRKLQSMGIASEVAEEAVGEVFEAVDEQALLDRALARRLRGASARVRDAAHFRRLLQQLVRQGFPASKVIAALKARAKADDAPEDQEL
jgi:regulatory protein